MLGNTDFSQSVSGATIKIDARQWARYGYIILTLFFGGIIVWSVFAPLASAVIANGTIKVDTNRKKIQHLEGGQVKDILVRNGDHVRVGDVLIRLDETRAGASHGVVQSGYYAALAEQARLMAERDGHATIHFPDELASKVSDPKVADLIAVQRTLFHARRITLTGQNQILGKQVDQLNKKIEGLAAQQRSKEEQLASLKVDLDGLVKLSAQRMVEKTRLHNVEREISRLEGERVEHVSDIASVSANISEKELQMFQIRKDFNEEVVKDLRKVQAEVLDYLQRINASRHVLEQTEIRSPVEGTVVGAQIHTLGGVVGPGEVLLEIVPAGDLLVVEAQVRPEDIDRVSLGLSAGIKITAFNQSTAPELNGKLTYVSADAIEDAKRGYTYFTVKIEVPAKELARLQGKQIQPGMMANVFIRTGERTFLDYLLSPLLDSLRMAWREA